MTRLQTLLSRLEKFYGVLPSPPSDPFGLFVWETMSGHSTPRKRDAAFGAFRKLRALTPDAMWRTPQAKLEASARIAGPYVERRLESLRQGVELFRRHPDLPKTLKGEVPAALKALKRVPGLGGDSMAYRMLLFAGDQRVLPVNAGVSRAALRLGYGEAASDFKRTARSVRQALSSELPDALASYRRAYLYLAHHGALTCTQTDPHCSVCPLVDNCPEGRKRMGGKA